MDFNTQQESFNALTHLRVGTTTALEHYIHTLNAHGSCRAEKHLGKCRDGKIIKMKCREIRNILRREIYLKEQYAN